MVQEQKVLSCTHSLQLRVLYATQSVKDVTAARQRDAIVRLGTWSNGTQASNAPPGEVLVR